MNKLILEDINKEFVDNISFCHIGYGGCFGYSECIIFMNTKGNLYRCNVRDKKDNYYINLDELTKRLSEHGFNLDYEGLRMVKDWNEVYMGGCGNYLYIKPIYALEFYRFAYGSSYEDIYNHWQEFAKHILSTYKQ